VNTIRNGRPRRARLAAVGAYAPERVVTNADLERVVDGNTIVRYEPLGMAA
jgi:3-oxoacyl-[acyl-carrier-protein] synthase III